jgi:HCOMODA/2-hydroxy-3-carboxy-muconic semialdehyde decarboxylase
MISIYMKDNAELILKTLPLGKPAALSPGEVERTAAMLLSAMPLARAWEYWTSRAGFQGI